MRHSTGTRLLAVLAATLAVAACGATGEEAAPTSPLNELWGEQPSPAEQRAQQLKQEEAVAACMQEEGWEYTPVDYSAQFNNQPEYEDPATPGYGEKYGYGIVRGYQVYEWPYIDADGNYTDDSPMKGGGDTFEDPNADYVNALSSDEQEQYYISLSGDWSKFQEPSLDDSGNEVWTSPPLDQQGCYGKAQQEVYGEQPWNDQDFNDRYSELSEQLSNDPAIDDAEITWSDCAYAADADYDFAGPDDVYTYVQNLLNDVRGMEPVDPNPSGDPQVTDATVVMAASDGGDGTVGSGETHHPTEAELTAVIADEVALWKVDQDCQDESGLAEIRRQREQEVVDTLREEFPQYIGSAGGGVG